MTLPPYIDILKPLTACLYLQSRGSKTPTLVACNFTNKCYNNCMIVVKVSLFFMVN